MKQNGKRITVLLAGIFVNCLLCGAQDAGDVVGKIKTYDFNAPEEGLAEVSAMVTAALGDAGKSAAIEGAMVDLLKDKASTFAARQFVCRKLAMIGTGKSVPALAAMLGDEKLGDVARYALGRIESPDAGKALRDALATAKGRPLVGVIGSLGERRDSLAVPVLAELAVGDEAQARSAAVSALGRIGTADSLKALRSIPGPKQAAVAQAAIECAYTLAKAGKTDEAGKLFAALYNDAGYPSSQRVAALGGLLLTRPDQATAVLLNQFTGDDMTLRLAAAKYIRDFPGEKATFAFAGKLGSLQPDAQVLLIGSLADRGDAAAVPAIVASTGHADQGVRIAALAALGSLETGAAAADLLLEKAVSGAPGEKQAAQRSLLTARGTGIDKGLLAVAKSGSPSTRTEAINALAGRGVATAVPTLMLAARDSDAGVRAAAIKALVGLAGAGDTAGLVELLISSGHSKERDPIAKAVVAAARQIEGDDERVKPIASAMPGSSVDEKAALLGIMAKLGGKTALQAVAAAAGGTDAGLRDAAVRALADWSDAGAVAPILKVVEGTRDVKHRVIALRGLTRLLGLPSDRSPDETMGIYKRVFGAVERADEKKALLPGISNMGNPEALNLVAPMRNDPALAAEALLAMSGIVRAMAPSYPQQARDAANNILKENPPDAVKKRLGDAMNFLERNEDFIVTWWMSEVYKQKGKSGSSLFDVAFPPEKDPTAGKWRVVGANEQDVILNLDPLGGDNQIVYLKAELSVPKATDARLEIGSDDGVKAWVGGKFVHGNNATRPVSIGQDKVNVSLKAGSSLLLLKIVEVGGNMGACCRVRAADGTHLPGLTVKPTTDQVGSL